MKRFILISVLLLASLRSNAQISLKTIIDISNANEDRKETILLDNNFDFEENDDGTRIFTQKTNRYDRNTAKYMVQLSSIATICMAINNNSPYVNWKNEAVKLGYIYSGTTKSNDSERTYFIYKKSGMKDLRFTTFLQGKVYLYGVSIIGF